MDSISTIIKQYDRAAEALREVEKKWPGCEQRWYRTTFEDTMFWLAEGLSPAECDKFCLVTPRRDHRPGAAFDVSEVGVVIFITVARGVRVAPKCCHYMNVMTLLSRVEDDTSLRRSIADVIGRYGHST